MPNVIWPFRADWSQPPIETLEWKTVVLATESGAEQRYALRTTPRRTWEISYVVNDYERVFLDLFMMNYGGSNFYLPLPTEIIPLREDVGPGQTFFACDTTYREIQAGSFIAVLGDNALVNELLAVSLVTPNGVTTSTPTRNYYPAGHARIVPCMPCRFSDTPSFTRETARVYKGIVRFESTTASVWPMKNARSPSPQPAYSAAVGAPSYPVMLVQPDTNTAMDYTYERVLKTLDNQMALPQYTDPAQRAFPAQKYTWWLHGAAEQVGFRDWLYAMMGQRGAFWMPTFNDDIGNLGVPSPNGLFSLQAGRELAIGFRQDGSFTVMPTVADSETVYPVGDLDLTQYTRISFMDLKRLNTDKLEITHQGDLDGVVTCTALARSAPDLRVVAPYAPVPYPEQYLVSAAFDGTTTPVVQPPNALATSLTITG